MGTDIRIIVERRGARAWVAVNTVTAQFRFDGAQRLVAEPDAAPARIRNYARFAALAGVRGDGPAARGLPEDASDTARALIEIEGGHSPSWLPLAEAARIFLQTDAAFVQSAVTDPEWVYFDVDASEVEQHRIVFWFDG